MRQRTCDCPRGQATVEFALLMPFFAVLVACILGVTVVCLDILRTEGLARTAARLASVSATPQDTAVAWVGENAPGAHVSVTVDESTVRVRLSRVLSLRLPLLSRIGFSLPYHALAIAAVEPPPAIAAIATNVAP